MNPGAASNNGAVSSLNWRSPSSSGSQVSATASQLPRYELMLYGATSSGT